MKLTDSRGLPVSTQSAARQAHALRADLAVISSEQGALPLIQLSVDVLGYGCLLGMHAFGPEETANYLRAEDIGCHALKLRDPWAVHALIAYNAAGRDEHQRRMLVKLEKCADGVHTNATITRELGLPLARAIVAMSAGRNAEAVELLLPIRSKMNRIGGSHAQRDLVQLTCIEAALRCGNGRLARALASERTEQKPISPFNWELTERA